MFAEGDKITVKADNPLCKDLAGKTGKIIKYLHDQMYDVQIESRMYLIFDYEMEAKL